METPGIEALQKKAAVVTEYFWLDDFDVGNRGIDDFHIRQLLDPAVQPRDDKEKNWHER